MITVLENLTRSGKKQQIAANMRKFIHSSEQIDGNTSQEQQQTDFREETEQEILRNEQISGSSSGITRRDTDTVHGVEGGKLVFVLQKYFMKCK